MCDVETTGDFQGNRGIRATVSSPANVCLEFSLFAGERRCALFASRVHRDRKVADAHLHIHILTPGKPHNNMWLRVCAALVTRRGANRNFYSTFFRALAHSLHQGRLCNFLSENSQKILTTASCVLMARCRN
jgi:hypothetical protein